MKKPENESLVPILEASKQKIDQATDTIVNDADKLRQQLVEIEGKCSHKKLLKPLGRSLVLVGLISVIPFSIPIFLILSILFTVSLFSIPITYISVDSNKQLRSRLRNELADKETSILKLNEADLDVRFKLLEEKYGEEID